MASLIMVATIRPFRLVLGSRSQLWSRCWCTQIVVPSSLQGKVPPQSNSPAVLLHVWTSKFCKCPNFLKSHAYCLIVKDASLKIHFLSQYSPLYWARDHRVHHKYTETDADPVNALRGFWFSHLGWLTMKRHPAVLKKGNQCDLSDIIADPVIAFGEKYVYA